MMMKRILVYLTLVVFVTSCTKDSGSGGNTAQQELILTDVAYTSSSSVEQKMDVYLPANRSTATTYTLIMIHGGSWSGGDKSDFNTDLATLRPMLGNYAVFNINYRLANGSSVLLQQQIDDVNSALSFIYSKANEYAINTSKIGVMGASAGAHLALLKSYKYNTDNKIVAVVDLFGPTDMTAMYNNHPYPIYAQPIIQNVMGTTPTTNASAYFNGSPINFVTTNTPPTIIFHGTADEVVPIAQSINLRNALDVANVSYSYNTYTGEGHGWTGAYLTDTYNKAVNFIKNYVK